MDRNISYAGQVPRALDFLRTGEFAMVGLAKIAEAMLGTSTVVSQGGFAVTPGSGLNIAVGPGQIYQLQSIEPTSLSALNVDGHQVLKQGVALDGQTLTLAPPATVGYAQNFLVQAAYADVQDGSIVLSYQNPTPVLDPNTGALKYVTYPGPGGNGAAQYTILRGAVSLNAKPGVAAPAGQQTTPAPDVGYVGLYVVTLAYGATSISSGSIAPYANAPFIPITLPQVPAAIQAQAGNGAPDTGTANAMVLALPAYTPATLPDYTPIRFKKGPNPNTGPATITINGTAYAVQTFAGAALAGGELPGNCAANGVILGGALRLSGGIGTATGGTGSASAGLSGRTNLYLATPSNTQMTLTADEVVLAGPNGSTVRRTGLSLTLDNTVVGAGGMDRTGSIASTAFDIYLIHNPTTPADALLAVPETSAPQLPTGYTFYRRLSWNRADGSSRWFSIVQDGEEWWYDRRSGSPALPVLANGALGNSGVSGSNQSFTLTAISLAGVAPVRSSRFDVLLAQLALGNNLCIVAPSGDWPVSAASLTAQNAPYSTSTDDSSNATQCTSIKVPIPLRRPSSGAPSIYGTQQQNSAIIGLGGRIII